jgi:hypothetical protein
MWAPKKSEEEKQDRQHKYKRNNESLSVTIFYSVKAIIITYSECVV